MIKQENFIFKDDEFTPGCECGNDVYYLNIGRHHFWVCDRCRKYIYFGSNLLSSWRQEDEKIWKKNKERLSQYKGVEWNYEKDKKKNQRCIKNDNSIKKN